MKAPGSLSIDKMLQIRSGGCQLSRPYLKEQILFRLEAGDFSDLFSSILVNPFSVYSTFNALASVGVPFLFQALDISVSVSELEFDIKATDIDLIITLFNFYHEMSTIRLKDLVFSLYCHRTLSVRLWKYSIYAVMFEMYGIKIKERLKLRLNQNFAQKRLLRLWYLQAVLYILKTYYNRSLSISNNTLEFTWLEDEMSFQKTMKNLEDLTKEVDAEFIIRERSRVDSLLVKHGLEKEVLVNILVRFLLKKSYIPPPTSFLGKLFLVKIPSGIGVVQLFEVIFDFSLCNRQKASSFSSFDEN